MDLPSPGSPYRRAVAKDLARILSRRAHRRAAFVRGALSVGPRLRLRNPPGRIVKRPSAQRARTAGGAKGTPGGPRRGGRLVRRGSGSAACYPLHPRNAAQPSGYGVTAAARPRTACDDAARNPVRRAGWPARQPGRVARVRDSRCAAWRRGRPRAARDYALCAVRARARLGAAQLCAVCARAPLMTTQLGAVRARARCSSRRLSPCAPARRGRPRTLHRVRPHPRARPRSCRRRARLRGSRLRGSRDFRLRPSVRPVLRQQWPDL